MVVPAIKEVACGTINIVNNVHKCVLGIWLFGKFLKTLDVVHGVIKARCENECLVSVLLTIGKIQ